MATVAEKIRVLRNAKGFSQSEVASRLHISRPTYLLLESGRRQPNVAELETLAGIFGTSLHDLLFHNEIASHDSPDYSLIKYKQIILNCLKLGGDSSDGKITKTKLAKLVYFTDFTWYFHNRVSMSGLKYRRIQQGPVPDQYFRAIDELFGENSLKIEPNGSALMIKSSPEAAPRNQLTDKELSLISSICNKWKDKNTQDVVDFTHSQTPWKLCKQGELIPYELILSESETNLY